MSANWMSPREYFERIVRPTVEDYQTDRKDHRRACAVLQLSSIAERYFKYHQDEGHSEQIYSTTSPREFVEKLSEALCPECLELWEHANGVKHHFRYENTTFSAMAYTATGAVFDTAEYESGGRKFSIDQIIDTVYEYWSKRLDAELEKPRRE